LPRPPSRPVFGRASIQNLILNSAKLENKRLLKTVAIEYNLELSTSYDTTTGCRYKETEMKKLKPKYKIGDVVKLAPCGDEKKPTKAKLVDVNSSKKYGVMYLIVLQPPFDKPFKNVPMQERNTIGDDCIEEKDIIGVA
jgi:hypothetical protein